MAQVNAVLEEFAGMSVFLENVAKMPNPMMRHKGITSGFKDLEELAKKNPEHAKLACDIIRKSTGTAAVKDISIEQQTILKRFIRWCTYTYLVERELDLNDVRQF
jgi:hypothetical protein